VNKKYRILLSLFALLLVLLTACGGENDHQKQAEFVFGEHAGELFDGALKIFCFFACTHMAAGAMTAAGAAERSFLFTHF